MKELISAIFHLALLICAYLVAHFNGYIAGRGFDAPWYADWMFFFAFIILITVYQITEPKEEKNESEAKSE